jgi:hypothetical protein
MERGAAPLLRRRGGCAPPIPVSHLTQVRGQGSALGFCCSRPVDFRPHWDLTFGIVSVRPSHGRASDTVEKDPSPFPILNPVMSRVALTSGSHLLRG